MEDTLDLTVDSLMEILASDKSTSDDFLLLLVELVLDVTFELELEGEDAITVASDDMVAETIDGEAAETLGAGDAAIGLKPDCIKLETVDVLIAARVALSFDSRDIFLANFFSSLLCLEDFDAETGGGLALIFVEGKSGK